MNDDTIFVKTPRLARYLIPRKFHLNDSQIETIKSGNVGSAIVEGVDLDLFMNLHNGMNNKVLATL